MSTPPLPLTPGPSIASTDKKKRVLLVDTSAHTRELRAETMRKLGIEVDSAADIGEARFWWRADLYDLILVNVVNDCDNRDQFCGDVRASAPRQRFAFLVGKPEYLSDCPSPDSPVLQVDDTVVPAEGTAALIAAALATNTEELPQRWGILEASRRISAVRSALAARTRAMRERPSPPRDHDGKVEKRSTLDDLLREEMQ